MVKSLKKCAASLKVRRMIMKAYISIIGEVRWETKRFEKLTGYKPNLKSPKTLNEKIAWLKINYIENFFYTCCDKYLIHEYLKDKLGKDLAPKLLFVTQNPKELTFENIKQFPCIIKVSNGSGSNLIVESQDQYTEKYLQDFFCRQVDVSNLHAVISLEHQYEIGKPYIVVEELLKDVNGKIPNDYKFLYINGQLEFIYCSVDRQGANVRQIYDPSWNRLHFAWVANADDKLFSKYDGSSSIAKPTHFDDMLKLSALLAKDFPLVRIDFYDTAEGVYIGEITLHHGSGHDRFYPAQFDEKFGSKLVLPAKNR